MSIAGEPVIRRYNGSPGETMNSVFLKQHAYSIAAMRKIARRRLLRAVFDFVGGDAGVEERRARALSTAS